MPTKRSRPKGAIKAPDSLAPVGENGELRVVIETPKGSRNKYAYKPEEGAFALRKVLPAGMTFPYDFGFIPQTKAEDGDPIDVLLLMEESAFPGCAVDARLVGVIRAEETEHGDAHRNDRLIAVCPMSPAYTSAKSLDDLGAPLVDDIERFFKAYQDLSGKHFKLLGRGDAKEAVQLAKKAGLRAR